IPGRHVVATHRMRCLESAIAVSAHYRVGNLSGRAQPIGIPFGTYVGALCWGGHLRPAVGVASNKLIASRRRGSCIKVRVRIRDPLVHHVEIRCAEGRPAAWPILPVYARVCHAHHSPMVTDTVASALARPKSLTVATPTSYTAGIG